MRDIRAMDEEELDSATVSSYLDIFKRLFLTDNQPPFSTGIRSSVRIRQAEKRHFSDPSLACALLKATPAGLLGDLETLGFLFEALCERDLRIYAESFGAGLYHYQDYKNREIDAVIELPDGQWCAFEIKLGANKIDSAADNLLKIKKQMEETEKHWKEKSSKGHGQLTQEGIAAVVAGWTGIPAEKLTEDDAQRLMHLEEVLHKRVIGQDDAVNAVAKAIRRGRVGLRDPKRPIGSFIFLGPTGVGKTELCRALAEALFGDENAMIRVDMSEYMEKHSVSKMIGSPPGYVGFEEGGQLTEKVRRKPYSVVLLDEIEKAHPDVFNLMLQVLEDGALTDSQGRKVDFKNTVIIMTSNVGAEKITSRNKTLGFKEIDAESNFEAIRSQVMDDLKMTFRPEFLNRVDDIIVFHQLTGEQIERIADGMLQQVAERMKEMEITLTWDEKAREHLAKAGFDPVYGARPLRRAIQSQVEDLVAEEVLTQKIHKGKTVLLSEGEGKLTLTEQESE